MSEEQNVVSQTTTPTIVNVEPTEPSCTVEPFVEEEENGLEQQTVNESKEPPVPEAPTVTYTEIHVPNFWSEGAFRKVTKRIEDGARMLEDISKMVHERAEIEYLYATKLRGKILEYHSLFNYYYLSLKCV